MKHTWLVVLALAVVACAVEVTVPTSKGPVTLEIHEAVVMPPPTPFTITTTVCADGLVGEPYETLLAGSGGVQPYAWQVQSGTLPPGLTLKWNTGVIGGTPTAEGAFNFVMGAQDSSAPPTKRSGKFAITISIAPPPHAPYTTPFPAGVGCWIYPGDELAQAMVDHGIGWIQYWSIQYNPATKAEVVRLLPYVFEMHPDQLSGGWGIVALTETSVTIDDPNHARAKYFPIGNNLGIAGSVDNDGWYKVAAVTQGDKILTIGVTPNVPNPSDTTGRFGWFNRDWDRLDGPRTEDVKKWLLAHAARPNCVGVNLSCEVTHGKGTRDVLAYLRANCPNLKVFTGPMGYPSPEAVAYYQQFDGFMTFLNVTRNDRMEEDVYYEEALARAYGKPWCMSPQPVNAEGTLDADGKQLGMSLANPDRFARALDLACRRADGVNLWKIEGLLAVENGALCANPERLPGIWAAIAAAEMRRDPPRTEMKVLLTGDWKRDKCICRIVGIAGYTPVGTTDPAEAEVAYADLPRTVADARTWDLFNAFDAAGHEAQRAVEARYAEWLKGR